VEVYGLLPHLDSNMIALQFLLDNLEIKLGELLLPSSQTSVSYDRETWLLELPSVVKSLMKKTLPFLFSKYSRELLLLEEGKENEDKHSELEHEIIRTKKALDKSARCIEFYATNKHHEFTCLMGNRAEAFKYLAKYFDPLPSLDYAISIYKVLEGLIITTSSDEKDIIENQKDMYDQIMPLVNALKKGDFEVRDKVKGVTFILEQELKVCKLKRENSFLDVMCLYIGEVLPGFLNREDLILQKYILLNWETFHVYHRVSI
jgi:hypothetical protein